MKNDHHVIGIFDNHQKAQNALESVVNTGVDAENLSLLVSQDGRQHHFEVNPDKSKTAEGAGYGAVLGGLIGGLGALAAGVVSVTVPGAILVSGPLAVALASGAAGAAVGGLAGGLVGVGIPADEVNLIETELGKGSIVVAVHSVDSDSADTAKDIFEKSGALRVH